MYQEALSLRVNTQSIFLLCWKMYISSLLGSVSVTELRFLRVIGGSFPPSVTPAPAWTRCKRRIWLHLFHWSILNCLGEVLKVLNHSSVNIPRCRLWCPRLWQTAQNSANFSKHLLGATVQTALSWSDRADLPCLLWDTTSRVYLTNNPGNLFADKQVQGEVRF